MVLVFQLLAFNEPSAGTVNYRVLWLAWAFFYRADRVPAFAALLARFVAINAYRFDAAFLRFCDRDRAAKQRQKKGLNPH